jgi:phosphoribosylformylglycinamidine synthase
MVGSAGADVTLSGPPLEALFSETVGRVVVETTDPATVRERFSGVAPVEAIGEATGDGRLEIETETGTLARDADAIAALRDVIAEDLE